MLRKTVKALVASAGLLTIVGAASGADVSINIYGASAQYTFWNAAATTFLENEGCTDVVKAEDESGKHGITRGTCGSDTVYIRYSSKASYDGIYSCKGEVPPSGQPTCEGDGSRYRELADGVDFGTGMVTSLGCKEVTIGASDVAGGTFGQQSQGLLKGCNGGSTTVESRSIPSIDTTGMTYYRPIIVPFGFFANTAVGENVTNLTRLQALMLFSGKAFYWSDFGPDYPNKDTIICLRHAGSGTHATLAAAVMRNDYPLAKEQDCPYISFNDGSSDMMKCINTNGGESTDNAAAVGYADADAIAGSSASKYPNVKALDYQGSPALRANIQNGVYDFWSAQWLYECDPTNTTTHAWVLALNEFASNDANLEITGKDDYWCAQSSMNVDKANDFAMPSF